VGVPGGRDDRLAIVVEDLHEVFRLYRERPPGLKERLYRFRRAHYESFHALNGVSFSVRHGESVAVIGHNGSGKSTLLKCLAGILPADQGTVTVNGRVASLLELGAGFHPDLSGRENIFLNGSILGLSRREIAAVFDQIVEFAGVRDFIDTPVRNYSSGMYVRLGFAVAVHVSPEILLVDEVLSVGDAVFQERSLSRMREFRQRGKTVVLVSHDLGAVRSLCDRTLVLDHGSIVFDGDTDDAIGYYEDGVSTGRVPEAQDVEVEGRTGDFRLKVASVRLEAEGADPRRQPLPSGTTARVVFDIEAREDVTADGSISAGINVRRPDMPLYVYETRTAWRGTYLAPPRPGRTATLTFEIDLNLLTGDYLLDLFVGNASSNVIHDRWQGALRFRVVGAEHEFGVARLDARIAIWNPDGFWPPDLHAPPLDRGGPRGHRLREGDPTPTDGVAAVEDVEDPV
jgi:ABC-type polysaccharide/polyol phosphate transport system ATPase subunit